MEPVHSSCHSLTTSSCLTSEYEGIVRASITILGDNQWILKSKAKSKTVPELIHGEGAGAMSKNNRGHANEPNSSVLEWLNPSTSLKLG